MSFRYKSGLSPLAAAIVALGDVKAADRMPKVRYRPLPITVK